MIASEAGGERLNCCSIFDVFVSTTLDTHYDVGLGVTMSVATSPGLSFLYHVDDMMPVRPWLSQSRNVEEAGTAVVAGTPSALGRLQHVTVLLSALDERLAPNTFLFNIPELTIIIECRLGAAAPSCEEIGVDPGSSCPYHSSAGEGT